MREEEYISKQLTLFIMEAVRRREFLSVLRSPAPIAPIMGLESVGNGRSFASGQLVRDKG